MKSLIIDVMAIPENGQEIAIKVPSTAFSLESSDVHLCDPVDFQARIVRSGTTVAVKGAVKTEVEVPCVRCVEPALVVVEEPVDVVVLPTSEMPDEEDHELATSEIDLYYVNERLDLKAIIWDHLAVIIPLQPLCRTDCKGLCPTCGVNLNVVSCECAAEEVDERLAELKKWRRRDQEG
jgi:uncharacterized protein